MEKVKENNIKSTISISTTHCFAFAFGMDFVKPNQSLVFSPNMMWHIINSTKDVKYKKNDSQNTKHLFQVPIKINEEQ